MRRGIVILLLVTVTIMLVMAAPALAKTGTKSGGYWPYSTTLQAWVASPPANTIVAGQTMSPHAGYTTSTGKCKVCHAVHGAGIVNAAGTTSTEKLLYATAAESCGFCHLGAGAYAIDPYAYAPWDSWSNYFSNDSSPYIPGVVVWTLPAGGHGVQDATAGRSGHNATHGHDNPQGVPASQKSYKGCVSCHSVHGANTMTDGALKPNILKNDPAKGVTSATGWGDGAAGFGSKYAPTTTQAEFCEDCHDGTKLVGPMAAGDPATMVTAIYSQTDFNKYFSSCGANSNTGAACHNSIGQAGSLTAGSIAQFGAFNNKMHNGRSHIMTTRLDGGIAGSVTNVDTETVYAAGNGCATCHNVPKYSRSAGAPLQQGAVFPHFWPSNELIQGYDFITRSDGPCLGCHPMVGTSF